MSDSLCRWMNQELQLSRALESTKLAEDFSNGYLIGEILHKHGMQDDFLLFLKKNTSIAKVSNFRRLEPTLKQLGISFDSSTAEDLMQEKEGAATRLLYQLYASLGKDAEVSSAMMKTSSVFTTNPKLPQEVKPHVGLKLPKLCQPSEDKCQMELKPLIPPIQQMKPLKVQDETTTKSKQKVQKTLHQTKHKAVIPPIQQRKPLKVRDETGMRRKEKEVQAEIVQFEKSKRKLGAITSTSSGRLFLKDAFRGDIKQRCEVPGSGNESNFQLNSKYIQGIRQRLEEEAIAFERREKQIGNFLIEQSKALETRQEAQRDEIIVKRLTRHSKLEQQLISQLMQIRQQKQVIQDHSEYREQQLQQRREKDAQEALHREMVLSQQAELAHEDEIRRTVKICSRIAAEHAQSRQKKHFDSFKDLLLQIVDLAINVGQYRQLIENLIPHKLMKGWMELFIRGEPLYQPVKSSQEDIQCSASLDVRKQEILNNLDYDEYTNMSGEWALSEDAEAPNLPQRREYCIDHIVQKLREIVSPPIVESTLPLLSNFTFKACVLGKCFSGKTTCLVKIAEELGICVLSSETLIEEALKAYESEELCKSPNTNALLVDIMVRAISQLPAQSDWILDGFPCNIIQAHLLEQALRGSVDEGDETTDIAEDPNPPKCSPCPAPILDLALLLDVSDERAVRRAHSHSDATISQPTEKSLYLTEIQCRIIDFHDAWPELKKWFGEKQNILLHVSADMDEGDLYSMVKSVLEQTIQKKREDFAIPPEKSVVFDTTEVSSTSSSHAIQPPTLANEERALTESCSSFKELQMCNEPTQGILRTQSKSTCSTPGSVFQPNMEKSVPLEIAASLCSFWDDECNSYEKNIKQVLQQLRSQLTDIDQETFNMRGCRRNFGCFELKQELVSLWQTDFTSIADDIRGDEDTKAEEHLRLDELLKQLQVIDDHEYENKSEIIKLSSEKCLEAHTALLISYHSKLMQVELSHFWETVSFLRVYYWSKHRLVPLKSMSKCHFLLETSEKKDRPHGYSHRGQSASRADPVEPSCKELFSVYEMAFDEISRLVSEENQQRETIKQEAKKTNKNESANAKQAKKEKRSAKRQTAKREDDSKMKHDQEMVDKIHKKYVNALSHEGKAAKMRIKLVADHGAAMIRFLQSRAQETLSNVEKSFQPNDRPESTDQLEEVVFHIIETAAKLQNQLSLHRLEEATELTVSELSGDDAEGDTSLTSSSVFMDQEASVSSLSQI